MAGNQLLDSFLLQNFKKEVKIFILIEKKVFMIYVKGGGGG
jgi:hypothetical protein